MNLRGMHTFSAPSGNLVTDFRVEVVGISHEGRDERARTMLVEGLVVFLVREPENEYDHMAVRVELADGVDIGYIPRQVAAYLSEDLDAGVRYDCTIDTLTDIDIDYILPEVVINCVRRAA
jgi:hypothetical protein